MNPDSIQRRVKVFRVLDRQGHNYFECIVIEDVERTQFRPLSSFSGGAAMITRDPAMDRSDAWNVLNTLRNDALSPEGPTRLMAADSIDAAVSQAEIMWQELRDLDLRGKVPSWAQEDRNRTDRKFPSVGIRPARPSEWPSDAEIERMRRKVRDFAAGAKLRWKRLGRTPAGRRYDVLTFSGSAEVLLGPTGIELFASQK